MSLCAHITWSRVLLFASVGKQLSQLPPLAKPLLAPTCSPVDRRRSDTLSAVVKIGTWWNSVNTGSGHSGNGSWTQGSKCRTGAGDCAFGLALIFKSSWFVCLKVSTFYVGFEQATGQWLGRHITCATGPSPDHHPSIFQEFLCFLCSWSASPSPTGHGDCYKCVCADLW